MTTEIIHQNDSLQIPIPERIDLLTKELNQHSVAPTRIFFEHLFGYYSLYFQSWKPTRGKEAQWQHDSLRFGIEKAALEPLAPHTKPDDLKQIVEILSSYFPEELSVWYKYAMQPINRVDTRNQRLLVATRAYFEESSRWGVTNVSLVK